MHIQEFEVTVLQRYVDYLQEDVLLLELEI